MDFSVPVHTRNLLTEIRGFVDEELRPLERHLLAGDWLRLEAALIEKRVQVRARGWWAPNLPRESGGTGASLVELGLLSEELGRTPLGHFVFGCQAPDAGNAELLLLHGTEAQKSTYLEPLAKGEVRSCFCMTEPEFAGSNPVRMGTRAVRDGDDFVINGHKWFATAADGARFAIVMAVTDPDGPKYGQASMILVDCDTPGFYLERNIPVMGHAGQGYFSHGQVRFENCRVPAGNLLGEAGAPAPRGDGGAEEDHGLAVRGHGVDLLQLGGRLGGQVADLGPDLRQDLAIPVPDEGPDHVGDLILGSRLGGPLQELHQLGDVLGEDAVLGVEGEVGGNVTPALHQLVTHGRASGHDVVHHGHRTHGQGDARHQQQQLRPDRFRDEAHVPALCVETQHGPSLLRPRPRPAPHVAPARERAPDR
jgi:hypothetical protein